MRARAFPVGAVTFVVAFGVYVLTASPALGWLDAPELLAAAATLGVPHPPSHPTAVILVSLLGLLPFGDLAVRASLASALAGAVAAAAVCACARSDLLRSAPELEPRARDALAVALALVFAFSFAAWHQAVRAEVYALLCACLATGLALVLDGRTPAVAAAGLLFGLAFGIHWFVAVLCLAPIVATTKLRRALAPAGVLFALALASWLYLPLRAHRDPPVSWGDPDEIGRFLWTITARAFSNALDRPASWGLEAAQVAGALVEQATPILAVLALAGAYLLLRRGSSRRLGLTLLGVVAVVAAGPTLIAFDPLNPDAYGYLQPSIASLVLLAAAGIVAVRLLPVGRRWLAPVLGLALASWQIAGNLRGSSLRGAESSDLWARLNLERLPARALFVTSYFETQFQAWALAAVEGARPDVERVDLAMRGAPGRRPEGLTVTQLIDESSRRPVRIEPGPTLPPDPRLLALAPFDDETLDALATRVEGAHGEDRRGLERVLLWHSFLRARFDCNARALARSTRLAPQDPEVKALATACGP